MPSGEAEVRVRSPCREGQSSAARATGVLGAHAVAVSARAEAVSRISGRIKENSVRSLSKMDLSIPLWRVKSP